jgi:hypothetical protein
MRSGIILLLAATTVSVFCAGLVHGGSQDVGALRARLRSEVDNNTLLQAATKAFVKEKLLQHCTNQIFVAETKAQNAKGISSTEIQNIDRQWQEAEEELPIMTEKLGNRCAAEVARIARENPAIVEAFVMDNQGAVVGENNLTSDYWQGDEEKWINSYNNGRGGLDVGQAKFDRSANAVIQQISLPVFDSDGTVIGAVTFGVSTESL